MAELDELSSLSNLLSPIVEPTETPIPATSRGSQEVPDNFHLRQYLSQDCEWGCMYNGSLIKCFPVDNKVGGLPNNVKVPMLAVNTDTYQFPKGFFISCVTEVAIHNRRVCRGVSKILMGLNVHHTQGALVIFDPIRGQPLKLISLPHPVTSLTVLSHFEEGGSDRPFFNEAMMAMVGIAAVGLQGGQVLIVDLGLDDPNLGAFHRPLGVNSRFFENVFSKPPHQLLQVDPHENLIATTRHHSVAKDELICLSVLNESEDSEISDLDFNYCTPHGETVMSFPRQNVAVTCVEYIAAIGSLVVGFGFGCFQIWRIDDVRLIFSSMLSLPEEGHQIFGFSFVQPVDDPKNYCYLWVLFGRRGRELHTSHVALHCLNFEEKPFVQGFGYTYEGLRQCVRRLTFKLEDFYEEANLDPDESLEHGGENRYQVRPVRIWTEAELTFFTWECQRQGTYYIGIFDLNQWYSNHTLEFIRYNPVSGLCPYWVSIPLETCDPQSTVGDVRLIPKTLERWENPHTKLDMHLYPASLSFQAVTVTSTGVGAFQHFGVQEKLIRKLLSDGANLMIQPSLIKTKFKTYGLQTVFPITYKEELTPEDVDRYYIFTVLIECRRTSIITCLAVQWFDGSYANVGCTLDLILQWVAAYNNAIRAMATEHWENLFCFKNEILPPETPHFINLSNYLWTELLGILKTFPEEVYSDPVRAKFLADLEYVLKKLVSYSAALLMMYRAEILPERDEMDIISTLVTRHTDRRQEVTNALEECSVLDPSLKNIPPMMIDYLLQPFDEGMLREKWKVAPEDELYPPRHVGYVLNMFMWGENDDETIIARIIAYFLLDISDIANQHNKGCLRGDFPAVMKLSRDEQAVVFNFWNLDQGSVHETLLSLSQRPTQVMESDELPWDAAVVICTALGNEDDVRKILDKSCPRQLTNLFINLMISSPAQYSILCDTICTKRTFQDEESLNDFFQLSEANNLLKEFMKTYLRRAPPFVTESLIEYLEENRSFQNDDRLLSIYIHQGDHDKISQQYDKMKRFYEETLMENQRQRWTEREALVKQILASKRNNTVMDFLRGSSSSTQVDAFQSKPPNNTLKIKSRKASDLSVDRSFGNQSMRSLPQFRRLQQSKPTEPRSPLRRYVGKLHSVLNTPKAKCKRRSYSFFEKSRNESIASTSMMRRSGEFNDHTYPPEDIEIDLDYEQREDELNCSLSDPRNKTINMQSLLQLPTVDHRASRNNSLMATPSGRGFGMDDADKSLYFTPGLLHGDSFMEVHSIMKKEDSVSRKGEKIRFLNLSDKSLDLESDVSAEEMPATDPLDLYTAFTPAEEVPADDPLDLNTAFTPAEEVPADDPLDLDTELSSISVPEEGKTTSLQPIVEDQALDSSEDIRTRSVEKRSRKVSKTEPAEESNVSLFEQSIVEPPKTRQRSTRSKTPTLQPDVSAEILPAADPLDLNTELSSISVPEEGKTTFLQPIVEDQALDISEDTRTRNVKKRSRKASKTEPNEEQDTSLFEQSIDTPERSRSTRSKTPTLQPVVEDKALYISEDTRTRNVKKRSRKASKTEHTEEPDTSLFEQSIDTPERSRSTRSKTPTLQLDASAEILPPADPLDLNTELKTPSLQPVVEDKALDVREDTNTRNVKKRSRKASKTEHAEEPDTSLFEQSIDTGPPKTRQRLRSTRSRTPTLQPVAEDQALDSSEDTSTRSVEKRSRKASKTEHTEEPDTSLFEQSIETGPPKTRQRLRSTRSKTPTLQPVAEDQALDISEDTSTRNVKKRSRKASKTEHTEEPDMSLFEQSLIDTAPPPPKTRQRSRSTRSKTPTTAALESVVEDKDIPEPEPSTSQASGVTTRSQSKTPSPVKTEKAANNDEMDVTPKKAKPAVKRRRPAAKTVFNYAPGLSPVLETSNLFEPSILERTITPSVRTGGLSPMKGRQKKLAQSAEEENDETEAKPRKRSRKSVDPDFMDATIAKQDDDARSEVSSTRSTRSTRSNRSTRSTDPKKSRARRAKSAQE